MKEKDTHSFRLRELRYFVGYFPIKYVCAFDFKYLIEKRVE